MRPPSVSAMLDAWEHGQNQSMVARGLTLLALACPDAAPDTLAGIGIGERDRRLLALRETTFGPRMRGLVDCPACGEQLETDIATADLATPLGDPALLRITGDGVDLELRLPDSRDLLACSDASSADAAQALLRRCVSRAVLNGTRVEAGDISPALADRIAERLSAADPQIEIRFALDCAACGYRWSAPFDVVSFLWAELESRAIHLLHEVHQLASVYGWSERDILGMSQARRDLYLRMVDA